MTTLLFIYSTAQMNRLIKKNLKRLGQEKRLSLAIKRIKGNLNAFDVERIKENLIMMEQ